MAPGGLAVALARRRTPSPPQPRSQPAKGGVLYLLALRRGYRSARPGRRRRIVRFQDMKRLIHSTAILVLLIPASSALRTEAVAQTGAAAGLSQQALLTTYCYTCHNTKAKMGGLALQGLDIQAAGTDAEIWEKAVRKLRGRLMPPPGSPQPEQKDIDAFVAWMENKLDNNPSAPTAGHVGIQRLSRT